MWAKKSIQYCFNNGEGETKTFYSLRIYNSAEALIQKIPLHDIIFPLSFLVAIRYDCDYMQSIG